MASGKVDKIPHIEEIGASGAWSWMLYDDQTVDLYLATRVSKVPYASWLGGYTFEFGPFDLPFELETGYTMLAGCKIGTGYSVVALTNALSGTQADVVGLGSSSGTQVCDVQIHIHGKKAG